MATNPKFIPEVVPEEVDNQDLFPRVEPDQRDDYFRYLMRRATWAIGVGACTGLLIAAGWAASFPWWF